MFEALNEIIIVNDIKKPVDDEPICFKAKKFKFDVRRRDRRFHLFVFHLCENVCMCVSFVCRFYHRIDCIVENRIKSCLFVEWSAMVIRDHCQDLITVFFSSSLKSHNFMHESRQFGRMKTYSVI